ncbi:hypothetical protein FRC02_012226 [Tulasnella sp. 418]|nr:hypothetical protein FRC02_012226 [Tulasnella sp. 418]
MRLNLFYTLAAAAIVVIPTFAAVPIKGVEPASLTAAEAAALEKFSNKVVEAFHSLTLEERTLIENLAVNFSGISTHDFQLTKRRDPSAEDNSTNLHERALSVRYGTGLAQTAKQVGKFGKMLVTGALLLVFAAEYYQLIRDMIADPKLKEKEANTVHNSRIGNLIKLMASVPLKRSLD